MRVAVLSDVHSNLEALEATLAATGDAGVAAHWVLGDIIGYGADPQAVLDRLTSLPRATLIGGNHDLCAVGRFDVMWFNRVAAEAIRWTAEQLSAEARELLGAIGSKTDEEGPLLVHGSVTDPVAEYVTNDAVARASFDAEPFDLCFFGHTHLPAVFVAEPDGAVRGRRLDANDPVTVGDRRMMVNPGSVGQPRDGDPRASFALYDLDDRTVTVHRVAYDIDGAQRKIREAGLPDVLADRLAAGQ